MPLCKLCFVTAVASNDSWDMKITKHTAHRPGANAGPETKAEQQNQQKLQGPLEPSQCLLFRFLKVPLNPNKQYFK